MVLCSEQCKNTPSGLNRWTGTYTRGCASQQYLNFLKNQMLRGGTVTLVKVDSNCSINVLSVTLGYFAELHRYLDGSELF